MIIRKHGFFLLILLLAFVEFSWLITFGSFKYWGYFSGDATYAATWDGFVHGRFDLPPEVLAEPFIRGGHYYTYFGPFPALIRGLLTPFLEIHISAVRLTIILAALICITLIYLTGLQLGIDKSKTRFLFRLCFASLALASPLVYVSTLSIVYNEAIIWATAECLLFNLLILRYIMASSSRGYLLLIGISIAAALPALTRANTLLGPACVIALIGLNSLISYLRENSEKIPVEYRVPIGPVIVAAVVGAAILCATFYNNYRRWNDPFNFSGVPYVAGFVGKDWLLESYVKAGHLAWDRAPAAIENYFFPHDDNFIGSWPYFVPSNKLLNARPFARHFGNIEPYSRFPMPLTFPVVGLFSILGILGLKRANAKQKSPKNFMLLLTALGGFATWISIFTFSGISIRYTCDLLPLMCLLVFFGIYYFDEKKLRFFDSKRVKGSLICVSVFSFFVALLAAAQVNVYLEHEPNSKNWLLSTFHLPPSLYERPLPPWEAENVFNEWKREHPDSKVTGP